MTVSTDLDRRRSGLLLVVAAAIVASSLFVIQALPSLEDDWLDGVFTLLLSCYGAILYSLVGVVVLWRRPGHGIGRLAIAIGVAFTLSLLLPLIRLPEPLLQTTQFLAEGLTLVGWIVGGSLLVVRFPSGDRTSRLGAIVEGVLVIAVTSLVVSSVVSDDSGDAYRGLEPLLAIASTLGFGGVVVVYVGALIDLALRYRRADVISRTQMRWVLAAEAVSAVLAIGLVVFGDTFASLWAFWLASMGLPVLAIALAITRYHLYEIDRIVSRSISYLVLTGVLFAAFGATTILLQRLVSGAVAPGGELEPWVVAVSTLVVAASFTPVRTRIQAIVDRRFNRGRYDAAGIAAGFSGRLRGQLDLPTVSRELAATTAQALEPSTTAVWLRPRA